MVWRSNITNLDSSGTFRSLNGAADEQIFIGRASKAGFYLFFKVWRDMPYDAVLEYNSKLFRIEVKGTNGNSVNVTRGGRSGEQINRAVDRTRIIQKADCDFVVIVNGRNGDCFIVPVDIIEILQLKSISLNALDPFKEKWDLFRGGNLEEEGIQIVKEGLLVKSDDEINALFENQHINYPGSPFRPPGTRKDIALEREIKIYHIWLKLAGN